MLTCKADYNFLTVNKSHNYRVVLWSTAPGALVSKIYEMNALRSIVFTTVYILCKNRRSLSQTGQALSNIVGLLLVFVHGKNITYK